VSGRDTYIHTYAGERDIHTYIRTCIHAYSVWGIVCIQYQKLEQHTRTHIYIYTYIQSVGQRMYTISKSRTTCSWIYTNTYIRTQVHTHTHTYIYIHTYIQSVGQRMYTISKSRTTCSWMYTNTYIRTQIHTHTHIYIYTYIQSVGQRMYTISRTRRTCLWMHVGGMPTLIIFMCKWRVNIQ
jgi:hypothetical protein